MEQNDLFDQKVWQEVNQVHKNSFNNSPIIKEELVSQEDSRFECLQQMERIHGECCFKIAIEGARGKNEERRWRQHNTAEKYGSFRSSRKKTNVKISLIIKIDNTKLLNMFEENSNVIWPMKDHLQRITGFTTKSDRSPH